MKIFLQIVLIVILVAGGIYLGRLIQEGMGYMRTMSGHTIKMSRTIDGMAADIKTMAQKLDGMHAGIGAIDQHMAAMSADTRSMAAQIHGMHRETAKIDANIAKLNSDMSGIQGSMSGDLKSMRKGVDGMAYDVRYMRDSLLQMSRDIHRGSEAFSSPQDYFRNMFDYGR